MTVKLRKSTRTIDKLEHGEKWLLLAQYIKGSTLSSLAEEYKIKEKGLSIFLKTTIKKLNDRTESNALINAQPFNTKHTYKQPSYINDTFLALLSQDNDKILSDPEFIFATVYMETLNYEMAILESGLDQGLTSMKRKDRNTIKSTYKSYLMLRSRYLQAKPNVKAYIEELREKKLSALTEQMSTTRLQAEHIELYEACKAGGNLREAISLLRNIGETVSLYKQKVEIEDVTPSKALDLLIQQANEADLKVLT